MTGKGEPLTTDESRRTFNGSQRSFATLPGDEAPPKGVLSKVDFYSMEPKPKTYVGGAVTLLVLAGTAAYIGFVIYGYIDAPAVVITAVMWSAVHGPYPAQFYCTSLTGCWVSNHYSSKWLQEGVEPVASQSACVFVPYGPNVTTQFDVSFSTNPLDGLSIIFQADQTDVSQPKGLGYGLRSDCACPQSGNARCKSGIFYMDDPGGAGIASLYFVETHNETAPAFPDGAPLRREWFITPANRDGTIDWSSTTCTPDILQGNASSYVQGRLRMEPSFTELTVHKDGWLALWGIAGGAYAVFLQIGAMILMVSAAASFLTTWWETRRVRRIQSCQENHMQLVVVDSGAPSISVAADSSSRPHTPPTSLPSAAKTSQVSLSGVRCSVERASLPGSIGSGRGGVGGASPAAAGAADDGRPSSPITHAYAAERRSPSRDRGTPPSSLAPSSRVVAAERRSSSGGQGFSAERASAGIRSQSGSQDFLLRPGASSAPVDAAS